MSTINATTIYSSTVNTTSVVFDNGSTNSSVVANTSHISIGSNVVVNSTAIAIGNGVVGSTLTSTGLSTNSIYISGIPYATISSNSSVLSYNVFTTTGWSQWTKPDNVSENDLISITMWGGGGGGSGNTSRYVGGGGGACVVVNLLASQVNALCNVYVGAGGVGTNASVTSQASSGQTSLFYTNTTFTISAYGGAGGWLNSTAQFAGGGGGWFSTGTTNTGIGGSPLGGTSGSTGTDSTFGGGGGANNSSPYGGGRSVYGGGGGAGDTGGSSVYGGGGGGAAVGGRSIFGGIGGNNSFANGASPGGGGGVGNGLFGNGARGEIRILVTKASYAPMRVIATNTSSGSTNITLPLDIQAGDLIIWTQHTANWSAGSIPTGFTLIQNTISNIKYLNTAYKIAAGTEGGTTISGMTGTNYVTFVSIIRCRATVKSVALGTWNSQGVTTGTLTDQTITPPAGNNPLVIYAAASGRSVTGDIDFTTETPAFVNKLNSLDGTGDAGVVGFSTFYDGSKATTETVGLNSTWLRQGMHSGYISITL